MIHPPGILALAAGCTYSEDEKSRELILMLLRNTAAPLSRDQFEPGHITATACVLHPFDESVLLVHHRRLDRWLLPGGHVEEIDESLPATARREALEETGVALNDTLQPRLLGLDVHGIPGRRKEPYHLHHDLIFSFRASSPAVAATEEVRQVVWCPP